MPSTEPFITASGTCAQVVWWLETSDELGIAGSYGNVSIGGVTLARAAAVTTPPSPVCSWRRRPSIELPDLPGPAEPRGPDLPVGAGMALIRGSC